MDEIKKLFSQLVEEAKEKKISKDRIELLKLIGIEAECGGCKFADKIRNLFPEIIN